MRILRDPVADAGAAPATQTTTQTPAPSATTIPLDRKEYDALKASAAEVETLKRQVAEANEYRSAASALMKNQDNGPAAEAAARTLLKAEGYTPAQIDQYVAENFAPAEEITTTPQPRGGGRGKRAGEEDPTAAELKQLRNTVAAMGETQVKQERGRLEGVLEQSITAAVDTNKEFGTLINALVRPRPEEREGETLQRKAGILQLVQKEIDREVRDQLKERRAINNGRFDESWIQEEAVKAAKAVYGKYRTLVGDPSLLGRTPETDAGEDYITNNKPVPVPSHDPKAGANVNQAKVREWAVDSLVRASAEMGRGGKTAV